MDNALPPAEELRLLDRELAQLDARRAQLLARRAWLVQTLQALRPVAAGPAAAAGASGPAGPAGPGSAVWPSGPVPETSPPSAQNVLLTLGGILLAIAAIAFTLVSWGHMGIGGRALVLGAVTLAALGTPVLLLRRGLASTAESVAALGLVLLILDAYALRRAALPDNDTMAYEAAASGALAALWAAYGTALGTLRLPLPSAVVAAQLPLPLWALASGGNLRPTAWAMLATAALDIAIALAAKPPAVRAIAVIGAVVTGGWSLLVGVWLSVSAHAPSPALEPALLLLAAAGLALWAAWRAPSSAVATATVAGLAVVAALGGVLRTTVPGDWAVPGYLLCAVALLALVRTRAPRGVRAGLAIAAGVIHAASAAWALPPVLLTLLRPAAGADDVWSGAPDLNLPLPGAVTAPVVLAAVATVLWTAPRLLPVLAGRRTTTDCLAFAVAWCAAVAAPTALSLPFTAMVTAQLLTVTAALAATVRPAIAVPSPTASDTARTAS
ncbi:SCO7613 C-terminal domain-containing membrane protein, partial [Streptomyces sp. NPDC054841]